MADVNEIPPFPNPGVRLIKEDEHVAVWEEVFAPDQPTPPHRHTRDYIGIFLNAGELTITPLAGEPEEYTFLAGDAKELPSERGVRFTFSAGTIVHSRVSLGGHAHLAVNEGTAADWAIIIEIKGTATEQKVK